MERRIEHHLTIAQTWWNTAEGRRPSPDILCLDQLTPGQVGFITPGDFILYHHRRIPSGREIKTLYRIPVIVVDTEDGVFFKIYHYNEETHMFYPTDWLIKPKDGKECIFTEMKDFWLDMMMYEF